MNGFNARKGICVIAAVVAAAATAHADGNGANVGPGGFLLNVIAFEECPAGEFLNSNRHMIAVQANIATDGRDKTARTNKIFLNAGEDFWVEDGNACVGGAKFHLPLTHLNCDNGCDLPDPTFTQYEVRARVLGKPGGKVTVTSCLEEAADDAIIVDDDAEATPETLCSVGANVWVSTREVGNGKLQNRFENVSSELLTVCVDTTGDGNCNERIGLFDERGAEYWWNWDAQGRPHAQLVFQPVQSGSL